MKTLIKKLLFALSSLSLRSDKIFVFGAWFGKRFSDNPRYLLDELLESNKFKGIKLIWIGRKEVYSDISDKRIVFVRRNSIKALWYQLRAKYFFVSHGYQDIGSFSLLKGSVVVQLWHGFPIKRIGADDPQNSGEGEETYEEYQYFLANSKVMAKRIQSAFKNYGANEHNTILAEQPRVDYLLKNQSNKTLKSKIKSKLRIPEDKKILTYLPTFRDNTEDTFSFSKRNNELLRHFLRANNMVVLERQHFARDFTNEEINIRGPEFTILREDIEVQDVLLVTDYLVTDFSSVYVDYLALDRPIIHFLYDGEKFIENDRGIYAKDPYLEFAGPVVYSVDELIATISGHLGDFDSYRADFVSRVEVLQQKTFLSQFSDIIAHKHE